MTDTGRLGKLHFAIMYFTCGAGQFDRFKQDLAMREYRLRQMAKAIERTNAEFQGLKIWFDEMVEATKPKQVSVCIAKPKNLPHGPAIKGHGGKIKRW